jgi:hypothetical protein
MMIDSCTKEFKEIYNKYKLQMNKRRKMKMNLQMVLEERNRQIIENLNEDDLIFEDAIVNKMDSVEGDRVIHQRGIKSLQTKKEKQPKKYHKDKLLEILGTEEGKLSTNKNLEEVKIDFTPHFSPLSKKMVNNSEVAPIKLPLITINSNIDKILLTYSTINSNQNNVPTSHKTNKNYRKINEIISSSDFVKKSVKKVILDSIPNAGDRNNKRSMNLSNHQLLPQSNRSNSNHKSNFTPLETEERLITDEYIKNINRFANNQSTINVLKVIDKQKKMKKFMEKIEGIEENLVKARDRSTSIFDTYDKKAGTLKNNYKKVVERNFLSV